jgi:hypothetical protein
MDALIASLLAWIVSQIGLTVPDLPKVKMVSRTEMVARFYGRAKPNELTLEALYSRSEHTIYFPQGWQPDDLRERSVLVHELVHHVQTVDHLDFPCAAAYEGQAFDLQLAWLRQQGVMDPYKLLGVDEFTIRVVSACAE